MEQKPILLDNNYSQSVHTMKVFRSRSADYTSTDTSYTTSIIMNEQVKYTHERMEQNNSLVANVNVCAP